MGELIKTNMQEQPYALFSLVCTMAREKRLALAAVRVEMAPSTHRFRDLTTPIRASMRLLTGRNA